VARRARLLDAAPAPEDHRGGARPRRECARADPFSTRTTSSISSR
jgi:hypothetical protein